MTVPVGSAPRVFVAEDDPEMRSLVATILRDAGYEVEELSDGGRLLVALAQSLRDRLRGPPDVVVSDVRMPIMSGLALVDTLATISSRIPMVLMTGFPDDDVRRVARRFGALLIEKPFEAPALLDAVEASLRAGPR